MNAPNHSKGQLTVAANDGSSLPQTAPKSAICRRIPPFIVVLTAGRIMRLCECADAILARHCDAIQVAANFRTLMRDLNVLERRPDLFPNILIFASLFYTVQQLYRRCRHLVKLRIHVVEIEMQTDDILHDRLKQTRPSFVDKTDILGPRPLIVFKYPWYQFLYNDSPGLGELYRNPWQHDWYVAGQLVPSGGIKILESWDIEWRSIWHHLDLVSAGEPFRYVPPPFASHFARLEDSPMQRLSRYIYHRPTIFVSGFPEDILIRERFGGVAFADRMLGRIELHEDDGFWKQWGLFAVKNR